MSLSPRSVLVPSAPTSKAVYVSVACGRRAHPRGPIAKTSFRLDPLPPACPTLGVGLQYRRPLGNAVVQVRRLLRGHQPLNERGTRGDLVLSKRVPLGARSRPSHGNTHTSHLLGCHQDSASARPVCGPPPGRLDGSSSRRLVWWRSLAAVFCGLPPYAPLARLRDTNSAWVRVG